MGFDKHPFIEMVESWKFNLFSVSRDFAQTISHRMQNVLSHNQTDPHLLCSGMQLVRDALAWCRCLIKQTTAMGIAAVLSNLKLLIGLCPNFVCVLKSLSRV